MLFPEEGYAFCYPHFFGAYSFSQGLRLPDLLPFCISMLIQADLVLMLFIQSCWWYFMCVTSLRVSRHSLTENILPSSLTVFLLLPLQWSLNLMYRSCIVDLSVGTGHQNSAILSVSGSYNIFYMLMSVRATLIYGYYYASLEYNSKFESFFSYVATVCSPLISIISLSRCLDFQY